MVRALGFSSNDFRPYDPGRLCRGRERWIDPYEVDDEPVTIHRVVITGAAFTDDSAADAQRGLTHSGVGVAELLDALFPKRELLAFMEDGHPADLPEGADGVELYTGHRNGGRSEELMVRWVKKVSGLDQLREVLSTPDGAGVLGFVWLHPGIEVDDDVLQRLFGLVGMGCLDSPPARFQPAALPDLLEVGRAVVLLHRDKHGPAVGVYTREPFEVDDKLVAAAEADDALPIPFAIPPMLARWDRALAEARTDWMATHDTPFPVPVSDEPSSWSPRRGRRRRDKRGSLSDEAAAAARAARGEDEE